VAPLQLPCKSWRQSLQLSAAEGRLNGVTKARVRASVPQAADPPPGSQFEAPVSRVLHEVEW